MTDLDRLRWFWIGGLADDLSDWAGEAWRFSESVPTPAGVGFPLASALAISRIARAVMDSDSYEQIIEDLERAQVSDSDLDSPRERTAAVAEAFWGGNWPKGLPVEPLEAERFFTEAWASARSLHLAPREVRRELSSRWGVHDPRVLDLLCSLEPSPFDVYEDLRTRILDLPDENESKAILANLYWQVGQDPNHVAAVARFALLPAHLEDVAEEMAYLMRLDHKLERLCEAALDRAPERHAGFADARHLVGDQRAALVALMESLTVHEVDLVRDALAVSQRAPAEERTPKASLDVGEQQTNTGPGEAPATPATKASASKENLNPIAISVRLRRLWTDEVGPWLEDSDNDLGSVWRDTLLRRVGLTLDVVSPINFGEGDPIAGIREDFIDRLAQATNGHVNRVRISFLGDAKYKPPRRAKTTDLDIFDPGDPVAIRSALASEVGDRLSRTLQDDAKDCLSQLRVAGASRHRMWLVAPTPEAATRVATTPGTAHALWDAVRRAQRVTRDPLYVIYSDHQVWADSPGSIVG